MTTAKEIEPETINPTEGVAQPSPKEFSWRDFKPEMARGGLHAPLMAERLFYRDNLDELLKHRDEFVVIKGDQIVGFYTTKDEAFREGFKALGAVSFLIQKVVETEPFIRTGSAAK